jgi:hypothetical protein
VALREQNGDVLVQLSGKWRRVADVSGATKREIENYHHYLYGIAKVPATWVFNDFGHVTCFMFKDKNGNRKLDPGVGERIHGEFFFTRRRSTKQQRLSGNRSGLSHRTDAST